jgi:putative tricarboxylic transport membrane protein
MRRLVQGAEAQAELLLALCLFVLSAAVWIAADLLPPPIFDPLGSAAVPKLVAIMVALLALAMLVQRLAGRADAGVVRDPGDPAEHAAPLRPPVAVASFAAMAAYPLAMATGALGFREATFVFVLVLGGFLSHFERRTMLILMPTSAVLAAGLAWLFSGVFFIDLPPTPWLPF